MRTMTFGEIRNIVINEANRLANVKGGCASRTDFRRGKVCGMCRAFATAGIISTQEAQIILYEAYDIV